MEVILLACTGATVALGLAIHRRNQRWTSARISLTHALVEQMLGYRTRLAQEDPRRWHERDDGGATAYLDSSRRFDTSFVVLQLVPRLWMIVGFAALARELASGGPLQPALAAGVGGVLLAAGAFQSLATGLLHLSAARVAWSEVAPLLAAPAPSVAEPPPPMRGRSGDHGGLCIEAKDLCYRYAARLEPALRGCGVTIRHGDRLLLEGPSGGGKSTLGMVLAGLRVPTAGLLLLDGIDRGTVGFEGWRERVSMCPQYHDNHVFSDTLAFNLLMGRAWPPSEADMAEAIEVCEELGLGPLVRSMSSGLRQIVGDSGWRLSHGERSRVFIARALLQKSDLLVFDESFGALDPETMRTVVECAIRRSKAMLVIAHP